MFITLYHVVINKTKILLKFEQTNFNVLILCDKCPRPENR